MTMPITLLAACLACGLAVASAACARVDEKQLAEQSSSGAADWGRFDGRGEKMSDVRIAPAQLEEVTPAPYVCGVRLAWSASSVVPTFEPDHVGTQLPAGSTQAVVEVQLRLVPEGQRMYVQWFTEGSDPPIFSDSTQIVSDGVQLFALTHDIGGRHGPLPAGHYRVEIGDSNGLIKSIAFEVAS
jgi:hypothetical protein